MSTLLVIVASVRPTRVGGAIADWVLAHARARAGTTPGVEGSAGEGSAGLKIEVADLRELALPVMDEPNHPRLQNYQFEHTKRWAAMVGGADGFIIVSPEYNHSIPGSLKNAIDYLLLEWIGKPVGLVTYGGASGGTRSAVALQAILMGLSMRGTRANVEISWVAQRIDADTGVFGSDERLDAVLEAELDELVALLD